MEFDAYLSVHLKEYETYEEAVTAYCVAAAVVLISFCILIFALYHIVVTKNIDINLKLHTLSLFLTLFLNFAYGCHVFVIEHINIMTDTGYFCGNTSNLYHSVYVASDRLVLLYFYLARFHIIFEGSTFDFKPRTYKLLLFATSFTMIAAAINFELAVATTHCKGPRYNAATILAGIQDIFWSIFFCGCFTTRLKAVIYLQVEVSITKPKIPITSSTEVGITVLSRSDHRETREESYSNSQCEPPAYESAKNAQMSQLCRKMVIITCVTSLTTVIANSAAQLVLNLPIMSAADFAVNGACLILSFKFADPYFQRICCCCSRNEA